MKSFFAFVAKETRHLLRDRRSLFILLGMPIAQVILFGFAITNELRDAGIAIYDPARDGATQEISRRFLASGFFRLEAELTHPGQMDQAFRSGDIKLILVFEPDFEARLLSGQKPQVQLLADGADPNTSNTLINYANAILQNYLLEKTGPGYGSPELRMEVLMMYNPQLKSVFLFVPGVITIILMLVTAMMTSIALTREKELGTMEVLLVSPLRPPVIVIGKVIPYIVLSLVNTLAVLALGYAVFGMPVKGNLALLLLECLIFILTALGLGILISSRTRSQQVALMISLMGLMLPTILLSGFIFPIENMPWPLQAISHLIPARWFIVILKGIMLKGVGLETLWPETVILLGMATFLILASIRSFKVRLQ